MLYLAIFLIVGIFTAIALLKISVVIEILKNDNKDHFVISFFTMGGILKYKYEFPFFTVNEHGIKMKLVKEHGKKDKKSVDKKKEYSFKDIIKWIKDANYIYRKNLAVIISIRTYIAKKLIVEDIRLNILIGAGEAHYTAILNGMLWTLCGSGFSILSNYVKIKNKKISIEGNFNEKKLLIDFYCIFSFKIVHIIVIGIKLLIFYIRKKINFKNKTIGGGLSG